jgi:hypothetical protein
MEKTQMRSNGAHKDDEIEVTTQNIEIVAIHNKFS